MIQERHVSTSITRGLSKLVAAVLLASVLGACASYTKLPSQNYDHRIKLLVLHYTAIDYGKSVEALVDEGYVSSHYLIPESNDPSYDGKLEIIQLLDESKRAWHAGRSFWQGRDDLNDQSIGVEIVNVAQCQRIAHAPIQHACLFPDYDPQQIKLVIKLAQDILARHPDIDPTAVVGHSDIAFMRKQDPGPRFPWQLLYAAGVGAWYDNDSLFEHLSLFRDTTPSIGLMQQALRSYGYGVTHSGSHDLQTRRALEAFQMHFVPERVSGEVDKYTAAALFALLQKYFPQRYEDLRIKYQVELFENSQERLHDL